MITATGLRMVQELITSGTHAHITYFGVGSGDGFGTQPAPTIYDSGLQDEFGARKIVNYTALGSPNIGYTYYVTWDSIESSGIKANIRECGLFSEASSGSMFNRATFEQFPFYYKEEYKLEWDVQVV